MIPTDLSPQDCLVAIMIAVSAADARMRTSELVTIERIVNHLPVFAAFEQERVPEISRRVFDLFDEEDGIDRLMTLSRDALPAKLYETAYALACDVAAADGSATEPELRFLEELRHALGIDRLHAAAIERGARVRHTVA